MTTFPLRIIRCYGDNLNTINQKQLRPPLRKIRSEHQLLLIVYAKFFCVNRADDCDYSSKLFRGADSWRKKKRVRLTPSSLIHYGTLNLLFALQIVSVVVVKLILQHAEFLHFLVLQFAFVLPFPFPKI